MSASRAQPWSAPVDSWWLGATAKELGDTPALQVGGMRCSFAELASTAEDVAAALAGAGVAEGDRVALVARPSQRVVEIVHAAQRAGAALALIDPRSTPDELMALVASARPRLVLADDALIEIVSESAREVDVVARPISELQRMTRVHLTSTPVVDPAAPHSLICTSGTTGAPKAVVLSHANHHASAVAAVRRLDYRTGQLSLAVLPLHHVGGLAVLLRAAIVGAEVLLQTEFDPRLVAQALAHGDLAHASLVPTMLHRLLPQLDDPEVLGGARACCLLVGGAGLDANLAARAHALGLDLRATYGMTETASQVATTERGELAAHPGTSGRALAGIALRIDTPDREGFGELCVRGAQVATGYLDHAGVWCDALRDGWLHTGDLARMDSSGRLLVGSRRVDLIVTGGENVRPEEVERVLEAHPAIAEAGVYGVPDSEWGQRVAALVVPRDRARIDTEELVAWCRSRLAAHKLPRVIDVAASLPRTASGKLQRRKLCASP